MDADVMADIANDIANSAIGRFDSVKADADINEFWEMRSFWKV
jgi:hypothetical protein